MVDLISVLGNKKHPRN